MRNPFSAATIEDVCIASLVVSMILHVAPSPRLSNASHRAANGRQRTYFIDANTRSDNILRPERHLEGGTNQVLRGFRGVPEA